MKVLDTDRGKVVINKRNVLYARIIESGDTYKVILETEIGALTPTSCFKGHEDAVKWVIENFEDLTHVTSEYFVNLTKVIIAEPHMINGTIISYTVHFATKKLPISANWLLPEFVENFPELKELM